MLYLKCIIIWYLSSVVLLGCTEDIRIGEELMTYIWSSWCILMSLSWGDDKYIICGIEGITLLSIIEWVNEKIDEEVVEGVMLLN